MRKTFCVFAALALAACSGTNASSGESSGTGAGSGTGATTGTPPAIGTLWVGGGGAMNPSSLTKPGSFTQLDLTCDSSGPTSPLAAASAFDPQGNLWVSSPTADTDVSSSLLVEWKASDLASCATTQPAVKASVPFPFVAMAFDASGNLWGTFYYSTFSNSPQGIAVYAAAALAPNPNLSPTAAFVDPGCGTVNALCNPTGLAFDADGTLWVGSFASVLAYSPQALAVFMDAGTAVPDHVLTTMEAQDFDAGSSRYFAQYVFLDPAFDTAGNLWIGVDDSEGNPVQHEIVEFSKAQLTNLDTQPTPAPVRIIDETQQQHSQSLVGWGALAFDAQGNLWAGASQTSPNLWRYPAATLSSANPNADIAITLPGDPSTSLGFAPTPAGLPLH
jgi:hypothetical protein